MNNNRDRRATNSRENQWPYQPPRQRKNGFQRLWLPVTISAVGLVAIAIVTQLFGGQWTQAALAPTTTPLVTRAPTLTPTVAPTSTPAPSKLLTLGVFIDQAPFSLAPLNRYTTEVGKAPSALLWFQDWGDPTGAAFNAKLLNTVSERGITPIISWEPQVPGQGPNQPHYTLATIINGKYDGYVRGWAHDAAVWGKPLYIRFAHEMNGTWYPWSPYINGNGGGDQYIAAWRHVVGIFRQEGATNVRWIWSPNTEYNSYPYSAQFRSMYPGDAYVDWIGLSGYNWGGRYWATLTDIYAATYAALTRITSKPIMITETGSAESGGSKAEWITSSFLSQLPHHFPHIRAVIWFDASRQQNWEIDTSTSSLAAFREVAHSPLFQGKLP